MLFCANAVSTLRSAELVNGIRLFIGVLLITTFCIPANSQNHLPTKPASQKPAKLKVGVYASLTGEMAAFGVATRDGIELATEEINKAGGLLGKNIELVIEDDRGNQEIARTVAEKLIDQDHVVAVLGEVASTRTIAGAEICHDRGIPMISPSATFPMVTQIGDEIFRVCFLDDLQATAMAEFAIQNLHVFKIAILTDQGSDYSNSLRLQFAQKFTQMGGEIVITEKYNTSDTDFSEQLKNINAAHPDAIYVPGFYIQVGQIALQARAIGLNQPLLGGDAWDSPLLRDIGGAALDHCYFTNHFSKSDPEKNVQKFVKAYKDRFKKEPDALAALAYDAAWLLFDAIKRAKSSDPTAIRDALAVTQNFNGVTGRMTVSTNREMLKPVLILESTQQGDKFITKIEP